MRYLISIALSALVTFGLFWVMQALIAMGDARIDESKGRVIEFVRLKKETDISEKKRKKPDKRPPPEPPTACATTSARPAVRWKGVRRRAATMAPAMRRERRSPPS